MSKVEIANQDEEISKGMDYKKMWQELKAKTTNPETLSLMAEMEGARI